MHHPHHLRLRAAPAGRRSGRESPREGVQRAGGREQRLRPTEWRCVQGHQPRAARGPRGPPRQLHRQEPDGTGGRRLRLRSTDRGHRPNPWELPRPRQHVAHSRRVYHAAAHGPPARGRAAARARGVLRVPPHAAGDTGTALRTARAGDAGQSHLDGSDAGQPLRGVRGV